ncbi:MAG: hypothetical protein R3F39_11760 [Myxococcota bacterium]
MNLFATVLYEDKMQPGAGGAFPLHDLVLAMVGDAIGREVWDLRKLIGKNPKNGVSKLIGDLAITGLLAQEGKLLILVDRDRIAEHVGLPKLSDDVAVVAALRKRSDAPDKLRIFFLRPNMEGLLSSIAECAPGLPIPRAKVLVDRDIVLNKAAFRETKQVRHCIMEKQPGVADLVQELVLLCASAPEDG